MSEISSNRDAVSTNSRIDRVRNHADERLGTMGGDGDGDVAHDARVDGEQIVTGHSGLSKGGTPSAPIARCQLSRRAARVSGVLFRPSARVLGRERRQFPALQNNSVAAGRGTHLSGDARGDDHDVGPGEGEPEAVVLARVSSHD